MSITAINIPGSGYIGEPPEYPNTNTVILKEDNLVRIHTIQAHRFTIAQDDPDLYAADPILEWQYTERGAWVMKHAIESPVWHRHVDPMLFQAIYVITAKLTEQDYTFYALKWS